MANPEHVRGGSIQRGYLGDEDGQRERERSLESVSPKTIPRPTPQRQSSSYSQEPVIDAQPPQPQPYPASTPSHMINVQTMDSQQSNALAPFSRPAEIHTQQNMSSSTSSGPPTVSNVTPQSAHSSLPAQPSPSVQQAVKPQTIQQSPVHDSCVCDAAAQAPAHR